MSMPVDERTLTVGYSLNRWDLFWVSLRGMHALLPCLISFVAYVSLMTSLSYVLVSYDPYLKHFILSNLLTVIGMSLVFYALYLIFCTALGTWILIKRPENRLEYEYTNRAEGLFAKSGTGEGLFRWSGLKSVKIYNKALYATTIDGRVYVIRAQDVGSPSAFQEFAELAVERFTQAKAGT
jgi:uncharacterized membrane protein